MEGKKTRGRRKIEIKKIEKEEDRFSAFSKRKASIYKKATELVTLCGAEVGFVIYSPVGTPFSFGHPSFKTVADKFLGRTPPDDDDHLKPILEANRDARIKELNQKIEKLTTHLEGVMNSKKLLPKLSKDFKNKGKSAVDADKTESLEELQQMTVSLEKLYQKLSTQIQESPAPRGEDTLAAASTSTHDSDRIGGVPPGLID